jgi:HEAT repeat protein
VIGNAPLLEFKKLLDSLLDERQLSLDAAQSLIRNLIPIDPLLDVRIMKNMLAHGGDARAVKAETAIRGLRLVASFSNGARLTTYLVQLLQHPSPEVRSKAVLLLGRANLNLTRVRSFLGSCDSRVRANAIETLWGREEPDVRVVLWQASKDPSPRVAVNALLGLCKAGDRDAALKLERLAGAPDAAMRSGSAWAMGEAGDREFEPVLKLLAHDSEPKVRAMAAKSLEKLKRRENDA